MFLKDPVSSLRWRTDLSTAGGCLNCSCGCQNLRFYSCRAAARRPVTHKNCSGGCARVTHINNLYHSISVKLNYQGSLFGHLTVRGNSWVLFGAPTQ